MDRVAHRRISSAVTQTKGIRLSNGLEKLFSHWFNGLVYNQIWEDPEVDLQALNLGPESRIMTISSAGCNALNYLVEQPRKIDVVDLNPAHIYLARLKFTALKTLPNYSSFLDMFGRGQGQHNVDNYFTYIRPELDRASRAFWEERVSLSMSTRGPRIAYFADDFYRHSRSGYFLRFVHWVANKINCNLEQLLHCKDLQEQQEVFNRVVAPSFDHWVIRGLGSLPFTVFSLGIPPQQFRAMKEENSSIVSLFRERVRRLACDFPIQQNYFAWQAFGRRYNVNNPESLPIYLQPQHYDLLKSSVTKLDTHICTISDFLEKQNSNSIDAFVLLDSQDWMSASQIRSLWLEIARTGTRDARILFRTAAEKSPIERSLSVEEHKQFCYDQEKSRDLHAQDRSAVYGGLHIYRKAA